MSDCSSYVCSSDLLLAPNSINPGSGKGEHDQYRNHIKKFPGQQGSPLLQCSIIRWLAILFLCTLDASYATLAFHVVRSGLKRAFRAVSGGLCQSTMQPCRNSQNWTGVPQEKRRPTRTGTRSVGIQWGRQSLASSSR